MAFKCKIGLHSWNGCKCSDCGKLRYEQHNWKGCKCSICDQKRNEQHDWSKEKKVCVRCGLKVSKFLVDSAYSDNVSYVKEAINAGADIFYEDNDGETAFDKAAFNQNIEICEYLIEKGYDFNIVKKNKTILHNTLTSGKLEISAFLIEKGADINTKYDSNFTALQWVAMQGKIEVVEFMLQKGADVNAKDKVGKTALHYAIDNQLKFKDKPTIEVCKLLIEYGANINAQHMFGISPLYAAAQQGDREICEFFLAMDARLDKVDIFNLNQKLIEVLGLTTNSFSELEKQIYKRTYFEQKRPDSNGLCSWDPCPCGISTIIHKGHGYLYIPVSSVIFRRDCLSYKEFQAKLQKMASNLPLGTDLIFTDVPVLVCEKGISALNIDPEIAQKDAKYWWDTGMIPLRPSPMR